jgi:serine protease
VSLRRGLGAVLVLLACAPAQALAAPPSGDPLLRYQWHLRAIGVPAAWTVSRGAGATVAVLDSGIAYEDRGPYRRAPDFSATRFVAGFDFVDGDDHPDDVPPRGGRRSHGTQIASIIAATAGNGIRGAGVAPAAAIMPIRVLTPDLDGSARALARGLRFAADHGADVANLSLAGRTDARIVRDAVAYALAHGVTVVAAAGNDGAARVGWPAAEPGVIAVGATDGEGRRADYSNYGAALDLVAPAGAGEGSDAGAGPSDGVLAESVKGGPAHFCSCFMASTSAAAAEVSGVAALLIASGRAKTPAAVRAALRAGARDLGERGPDREYGAGLVQAPGAREAARPSAAAPAPGPPSRPEPQQASRSSALWWVIAAVAVALASCALMLRARRRAT